MNARCEPCADTASPRWGGKHCAGHNAPGHRRGPLLVAKIRVSLNSEQIAQPRRDPSHASSGCRSCFLSRACRPAPTLWRT